MLVVEAGLDQPWRFLGCCPKYLVLLMQQAHHKIRFSRSRLRPFAKTGASCKDPVPEFASAEDNQANLDHAARGPMKRSEVYL